MSITVLFQTIQFSISTQFKCQNVLFQTIQFSISALFSSIWPIRRALSDATTPSQSGPGSDGNEEVLCITQSSSGERKSLTRHRMSWWWGTSSGALRKVQYLFIAFTPRSTLNRSDGTGLGPIYGSNRNIQSFRIFDCVRTNGLC